MEILSQPLEAPALVHDYLRGGDATSFYSGDPRSLSTFSRRAEAVMGRFGAAERRRAAACLRSTSSEAEARLERWVRSGGMVVTTGQQAGLFGGPLYTLYKALTAARHAAAFEELLGVPVLPVFWVASEDHDWAEVNHVMVPDLPTGELRRCALPGEGTGRSMSETHLGDGVQEALRGATQLIQGERHAEQLLRWLRDGYHPGARMSDAFAELMMHLLAPHGVYLADAAAPALKAASAGVLLRALEDPAGERSVAEDSARLERAGFHPQVAVIDGAPLLFHHGESGRERLLRTRLGIRTAGGGDRPVDEVGEELAAHPGRFSPNVHLRPVVESAVFPVLTYVGGPAEIAYFAQTAGLFRSHGMEPPPVLPRASFLLVPEEARSRLDRIDLDVEALRGPEAELAQRLLRERIPGAAREALDSLRAGAVEGFRALMEGANVDPPTRLALGAQRNLALAAVDRAERKLLRGLRRREVKLLDDLRAARVLLRPDGAPQERVHSILPYLAREGEGLLARLAERVEPPAAARVPA
jgi:bacillithiol synthase